jgi:hypothetical protein
MKKFIGKPYAGKPHVRIDEGAGKGIFPLPALLYWQFIIPLIKHNILIINSLKIFSF